MSQPTPPARRPDDPRFSSGPCAKRPGWHPGVLERAQLGRSHRYGEARVQLREVIERSRRILGIPDAYRIAIMPASDTGAFEAAMWNLLGARGTDVLAWEAFGKIWITDAVEQLGLADLRVFDADYGQLPDLTKVDTDRDVVFTWNGTASGVCVPHHDWIKPDRQGLTLCDATSAVFAMDLPWDKLDVTTWSWQKVMGGEAQHGMLVLSPRAIARLESYTPPWPLPKLFRLTANGTANPDFFDGGTLNTPSMLCVADHLDGLDWAESIGGLPALIERTQANHKLVADWVADRAWVDFLAADPATRSPTSMCLQIVDPWFTGLDAAGRQRVRDAMVNLLADEGVAFDVGSYRDAPPGLRIWGGATVEPSDMQALLPWLDWAFAHVKAERAAA
jgi:phosphoserine aminotransferase